MKKKGKEEGDWGCKERIIKEMGVGKRQGKRKGEKRGWKRTKEAIGENLVVHTFTLIGIFKCCWFPFFLDESWTTDFTL